jgi:hypothetical protein
MVISDVSTTTSATSAGAIIGFLLGSIVYTLGVIAIGTWAGSMRAAYIRRYGSEHGERLPAGYIEEALDAFEAWGKTPMREQLTQSKQRMLSVRVWPVLHERQDDPVMETLRRRAMRRSHLFRAYIVLSAAAFVLLYWFVLETH